VIRPITASYWHSASAYKCWDLLAKRPLAVLAGCEDTGIVHVKTTREDDVLLAVIDDGKANALSFEVLEALRLAVSTATAEGKSLVISGREGYFCAGFDLSVIRGTDPAKISALNSEGRDLFRDIVEAPIPVVAACTGHALAAGALLLLAADYRIGGLGNFKIGLNEVSIGLALPDFAMSMARHRIDPAHLTSAALLSEIYTPDRACHSGYLDVVDDDPLAHALVIASRFGSLPKEPFAITKRRLRDQLRSDLDELTTDSRDAS
jgi:enoyl-CoA hydratase